MSKYRYEIGGVIRDTEIDFPYHTDEIIELLEEKERFEWNSRFDEAIKDNQTGDIVNAVEVLNKQDKRIKELELLLKADKKIETNSLNGFEKLRQKNRQLKQQLHELPKKIVEEVEKNFTEYLPLKYKTGAGFYCRLNAILKKYGGKYE